MRPVPIGLASPLAAFLTDARSVLVRLLNPGQPVQEFALLSTDLPAADDWKNSRVLLTDKNCLAISTSVAGVWTWLRADGSAI